MDYREVLRDVRSRPGMFFGRSELGYDKLVAFITGLDIGSQDSMLTGFREFLILKLDGGDNLVWSGLVVELCVPAADRPLSGDDEQAAVDGLFDLLDEFLAETSDPRARSRIYHEYFLRLQRQCWYDVDLERFDASPTPPHILLVEAAARLGLERSAIFDLIARQTLRPARVGAELYVTERHLSEVVARLTANNERSSRSVRHTPENRT
ncbi:hypothetical protein ABZW96_27625 [Nocardia sp. NPDC004168]|uniref:hypothetical protein n=1 Tax=Nocardia sp. NPDC004168 TaxID=3154452 RepID=UPI0033A9F4D8